MRLSLKRKNQWLLTGGLAALLTGGSLAWWMHGAHASGIPSANALHYAGTLNE